jgi:hypothetical protein
MAHRTLTPHAVAGWLGRDDRLAAVSGSICHRECCATSAPFSYCLARRMSAHFSVFSRPLRTRKMFRVRSGRRRTMAAARGGRVAPRCHQTPVRAAGALRSGTGEAWLGLGWAGPSVILFRCDKARTKEIIAHGVPPRGSGGPAVPEGTVDECSELCFGTNSGHVSLRGAFCQSYGFAPRTDSPRTPSYTEIARPKSLAD